VEYQSTKGTDNFVRHKFIRQRLHLSGRRHRYHLPAAINHFELISKFAMRSRHLGKGEYKRHDSGEILHRHTIVDIDARDSVATQHVLQHPLAKDYA
jgi:hypothetical protein